MEESFVHNEAYLKWETSRGDEDAFRKLFNAYHGRLFQYVSKIVKSNEVAEEIVMDVFLKLWLGREKLPEIDNLAGFIFKIAYTKTIDFFRSVAKDKKLLKGVSDKMNLLSLSDAHDKLVSKEFDEQIRKAVSLLPPKRKQIYELSRQEDMSHEEIAQQLEISKHTVANAIVAAKQFIAEYIKRNIDLLGLSTLIYLLR